MGVEVPEADVTAEEVEVVNTEGNHPPEMESKAKLDLVQDSKESVNLVLVDSINEANVETKEVDHTGNANFPTDVVDEWPAPKQIHTFYFVKSRSYEDPKLKAKIDQADKEIQKKNQARYQITEALKAKRSERANIISQLKPLTAENKQYNEAVNGKIKEMEPLQTALGKFRNANNVVREKGMGLCYSEEELNDLIKSLHYRISHESMPLDEEKQLLREIKQLEGTRGKVIANAAMRAKIQDTVGQKEVIQDQVKIIGADIDGVRKDRQAVRTKIKHLEDQLKVIDAGISSLQEELESVNEKKDKAFEILNELRKARDTVNACYYQNRSLLNNAKELAAKKDITALEGLCHSEVENFMSKWSSHKVFREDYEKRILTSLDNRQLCRDGRMRNPDEKHIMETQQALVPETTPAKVTVKQAKKIVNLEISRADTASIDKIHDQEIAKVAEADLKSKKAHSDNTANSHDTENSQKESRKSNEIDAEKLRETKREEDIAKSKLGMERKKKLAEKSAAKAAARAQKEADKKLKDKEKRAKKKAAVLAPTMSDEQVESEVVEVAETNGKVDAPAPEEAKQPKENIRYRNFKKGQNQLPKVILKRKKSRAYWSWVAPAAVVLGLTLVVVGFGYYYLQKGT
ncbi:proton pump-interactor BIP131-like [Typha angustifolia]|uniref:proton pump-interactor BIP131-like n=1 Tax=Typha angustifolia TaxID=59011 RepID=UPI003C2DC708